MRILWLKTELLHPVDKGGKIRTYQMLKELKKDHHITYLTLDDGSGDPDALEKSKEYSHETVTVPHTTSAKFSLRFYTELFGNLASRLPYAMQKYISPAMAKKIREVTERANFDVVVCDFLMPSVNVPDALRFPTVLFQHNVEAMIWQRHYEVATNPLKKAYLKSQWRKSREYEASTCRRFDMIAAVSPDDAESMRREYGIENVRSIPTGVDTEFFTSRSERAAQGANLVFTGSMDWLPNEDAIGWFTKSVLPSIREEIPNVTLTVVGRNPLPALVEMSKSDSALVVTGRVPDVRPYMENASVYIVPIRIGGGTRLKIFEAMSMGLPVVSTTVGAEGLPVVDEEDVLIRDSEHDFADAIVHLLKDPERQLALGMRAAENVRRRFSWKAAAEAFSEICDAAVEAHAGSDGAASTSSSINTFNLEAGTKA